MKRAVWLATLMWCWMGAMSVQANDHDVAEMLAKQEIEYLQRLYARATDQIGTNVPENIEAGLDVLWHIGADLIGGTGIESLEILNLLLGQHFGHVVIIRLHRHRPHPAPHQRGQPYCSFHYRPYSS